MKVILCLAFTLIAIGMACLYDASYFELSLGKIPMPKHQGWLVFYFAPFFMTLNLLSVCSPFIFAWFIGLKIKNNASHTPFNQRLNSEMEQNLAQKLQQQMTEICGVAFISGDDSDQIGSQAILAWRKNKADSFAEKLQEQQTYLTQNKEAFYYRAPPNPNILLSASSSSLKSAVIRI